MADLDNTEKTKKKPFLKRAFSFKKSPHSNYSSQPDAHPIKTSESSSAPVSLSIQQPHNLDPLKEESPNTFPSESLNEQSEFTCESPSKSLNEQSEFTCESPSKSSHNPFDEKEIEIELSDTNNQSIPTNIPMAPNYSAWFLLMCSNEMKIAGATLALVGVIAIALAFCSPLAASMAFATLISGTVVLGAGTSMLLSSVGCGFFKDRTNNITVEPEMSLSPAA